jgi:hypothetical protein
MMADLNLGNAPGTLTVTLVRGADFASGIDSLDGDWPSGTVIRLVFNDRAHTAWTAALNGAEANWNIDKAAVNALIGGMTASGRQVRLIYSDGPTEMLWAVGEVKVV